MNASSERDWPFAVRRLSPNLGAEISGLDLRNEIADELFSALRAAWLRSLPCTGCLFQQGFFIIPPQL